MSVFFMSSIIAGFILYGTSSLLDMAASNSCNPTGQNGEEEVLKMIEEENR